MDKGNQRRENKRDTGWDGLEREKGIYICWVQIAHSNIIRIVLGHKEIVFTWDTNTRESTNK